MTSSRQRSTTAPRWTVVNSSPGEDAVVTLIDSLHAKIVRGAVVNRTLFDVHQQHSMMVKEHSHYDYSVTIVTFGLSVS